MGPRGASGSGYLPLSFLAILAVPAEVIPHHEATHKTSNETTTGAETGRRNECRLVPGFLVLAEDVARNETHEVGERDTHRRQHHTATLVGNVVVVPGRKKHRWRGCAQTIMKQA